MTDITDRRFGRLVAKFPTAERSDKGYTIWRCLCDCGRMVDIPFNCIMYGNQTSCGCKKREHDKILGALQTRVDGTSLDIIKSRKLPLDNTTGYKGVYLIKGRYVAKLVFQKKAYYLGSFESIEEAHKARLAAEEALITPTVAYHARWKARAELEPEWAAENPMRIFVSRDSNQLSVSFLPRLDA